MNRFEFRPVGQGLFYTGSINNKRYNFVYDCGTENAQQIINNQIDDYLASIDKKINFVVISHLHKDHFSGLKYLIDHSIVNRIYLPYLGNDKLVISAILIYVIFGHNHNTDNGNEIEQNFNLFYLMCHLYGVFEQHDREDITVEFIFPDGDNYNNSHSMINYSYSFDYANYWRFKFIQSCVSQSKLNKLHTELKKLNIYNSKNIIDKIKSSKNFLNDLKIAYENVFGTGNEMNLTSLILVHYPLNKNCELIVNNNLMKCKLDYFENYKNCFIQLINHHYPRIEEFNKNIVTALTGDAMFNKYIANEIKKSCNKNRFLLLQVPHHGSKYNFKSLIKLDFDANLYVISYGENNRYNHPSISTIAYIVDYNKEFYLVNESSSLKYKISPL